MNSKERTRAAAACKKADCVPADFECVAEVGERLLKHYGFSSMDQLYARYGIDMVTLWPQYIGPEMKSRVDKNGETIVENCWGFTLRVHDTGLEKNYIANDYALQNVTSMADLNRYRYPNPDWFDYESIKPQCEKYKDKGFIVGHEGPFQHATFLMKMDELFMLMIDEPEVAHALFDRMVAFELEYYERLFIAADGQIDILRTHDDYGTQISMLFGLPMWRDYFKANTKKLADLAHRYGAFFLQHSCGSISPLIPDLIECGVDILEPLQKLPGLYPEDLQKYAGKIAFHGGIDTQNLLPNGTPKEVLEETEKYVRLLGEKGYILMASQGFESDVPFENIEAVYTARR